MTGAAWAAFSGLGFGVFQTASVPERITPRVLAGSTLVVGGALVLVAQ